MARTSLRPSVRPSPRPTKPLELVQIDHTLVDIMVVDELERESMGRPWVTIAFDVAIRVVLAFTLSLNPPSATSVGLALSMAALSRIDGSRIAVSRCAGRPTACPKHYISTMALNSIASP